MSQQVEITISPDGEITVEARGIKGKGCEALTEAFERGLGARTSDKRKPEYHGHDHQHEPNRQGAG